MLEMREGDAAPEPDETQGTGVQAPEATVNCPYCDAFIPDEKVATGICMSCFNALPTELDDCYGPGAR